MHAGVLRRIMIEVAAPLPLSSRPKTLAELHFLPVRLARFAFDYENVTLTATAQGSNDSTRLMRRHRCSCPFIT